MAVMFFTSKPIGPRIRSINRCSDLHVLDLKTHKSKRLDKTSSDSAENYPRWSSNGRWFSFTSNRYDGLSALPWFAYFDSKGDAHEAFVLPREDPGERDTFIDTYDALELVKSRVLVSPTDLANAMQRDPIDAHFPNPPVVATYTGATRVFEPAHRGGADY